MFQSCVGLVRRLWADDRGSVIAAEYLALGGIVALGTTAGMQAMRDATVDEMKEYGQTVRTVRQQAQPVRVPQATATKPVTPADYPAIAVCP